MRKIPAILGFLIAVSVTAMAGQVTFYSGHSVVNLEGSDTRMNISLSSSHEDVRIESERLVTAQGNLSVENYSTRPIDVELKKFNFSDSGNFTVFRANTTDNDTVEFGLEGVGSGTYTIWKDDQVYETRDISGTDLYFNNSNWSYHEFKVSGDNQPPDVSVSVDDAEIDAGNSVTISCDVTDDGGISSKNLTVTDPGGEMHSATCDSDFSDTDETGTYDVNLTAEDNSGNTASDTTSFDSTSSSDDTDDDGGGGGGGGGISSTDAGFKHSWNVNPTTSFTAEVGDDVPGISTVSIETESNTSSMTLTVRRLDSNPTSVKLEDVAGFISIDVDNRSRIASGEVEFTVNSSWASRYDRVSLLRYTGTWDELNTLLVEASGERWTYRATTPGFSSFSIKGFEEETTDNQTSDSQTGSNGTTGGQQEQTGEEEQAATCGNNVCETSENASSCSLDCAKPTSSRFSQRVKVAAVFISAMLLLAAAYYWRNREELKRAFGLKV